LNIAVFDGHLDPIVKCDANARAGHKTRNHAASAVQGDVISPYDDVALVCSTISSVSSMIVIVPVVGGLP